MCGPCQGCINCPHGTTAQCETTKGNSRPHRVLQMIHQELHNHNGPDGETTKEDRKINWTSDYQATLNKLKERLVSAPILVYPD